MTDGEEQAMETETIFNWAGCWADPLNRRERAELARKLARACQRFYNIPAGTPGAMLSQIVASAEMSELHMDVTERATYPGK